MTAAPEQAIGICDSLIDEIWPNQRHPICTICKKTVNICSLIFVWSVLIEVPDSSGSTTHTIAVWIKSKTFTESLISSLIEEN